MISFVVSILLLVLGYILYGAFVDKVVCADASRPMPCDTLRDGVDFIPMPAWKVFLIQFLNIAGTGPVFGAIQGILFGPAAYFWIVLGCVFGGAMHDYMSGMISIRKNGASLPEIIGDELGKTSRMAMRVFTLVLMILVGAVFTTTPAGLLTGLIGGDGIFSQSITWVLIILFYYILATLLPIDKLIGKIYPVFGLALLIMALGVGWGIFSQEGTLPEITDAFANHHPASKIPLFPGLCITIACGAVSGFHATQSPMMGRCMKNEKLGRHVFYGAMITEGIVAMIWAAAAIKYADSFDVTKYGMSMDAAPYDKLWALMTNGGTSNPNPAVIVNDICHSWLGSVGAVLAILGVVAAPITSGDTSFRSARLIAADFLHFKQNKVYKRVALSLPIFALSALLMFVKFDILWRYFAWFNQTLSVFTLWAITVWLSKQILERNGLRYAYLISFIPAMFMTFTCVSYILIAPEGFGLNYAISYTVSAVFLMICARLFERWLKMRILTTRRKMNGSKVESNDNKIEKK